MSILLIKWTDNWADEMDLEGHFVMTSEEWGSFEEKMESIDNTINYVVGSNEEIEYVNGVEALKHFSTTEITEEEYQTLQRLNIDLVGFTGPDIDEVWVGDDCDYDSEQPEEEIKFWMNWTTKRAIPKIPLSFKEYNWEKKVIELKEAGYVVTYKGKYGETWELKETENGQI